RAGGAGLPAAHPRRGPFVLGRRRERGLHARAVRPRRKRAGPGGSGPPRAMSGVFLSVVLPCRDQEDHIAEVVRSYAGPLERAGRTYELVVVPNACTDGTEAVVRALAEADPRIRVVVNPRGGWGLSVLTGLAA